MQNETARHKGKQEEGQAGRQDQRQDLVKAIQHQGGHLKKALRTPTVTVHCLKKNASSDNLGNKLGDKGHKTSGRKMTFPWQVQYKRHVHQSC